ncbi:MAG: hypothetical protein H0W74_07525 [Sphingosinicella sp.]|nr:hypothetical protein [Sphingosinicella sp.]
MDRRKQLIIGLAALLLLMAAVAGFSLVRTEEPETAKEAQAREEAIEDACASRDTFLGLKQLLFQQAVRGRAADPANFDTLAASAFVRMENPVVKNRDEELGLTGCNGRLILELPPGAESAFGGERRLAADVDYEVQQAADGSGPVYRLTGAESIVSGLAAFDLRGQRLRIPAASDARPVTAPEAAEPEPNPSIEPSPPLVPTPVPTPPRRTASNPSFDCDDARTRGEIMVCGSASLAAKDRAMAATYAAGRDDGNRRTRRALERTRDAFLAYRDRCSDQACVSQAYDGRMREIRDILAAEN